MSQVASEPLQSETPRWLVKDDIIHKDDHFKSAGSFYPVCSTVGLPWHGALPPMWRGPLPERKSEPYRPVISQKHQEFLDLVEMAGFILPNQFKQWRRFFLDEKNFLAEAEHWLSLRLQNRFPRIEDDVDKGLMPKGGSNVPASHPRAYQPSYGRDDDDDYWTSWAGWGGGSKWSVSNWRDPKLPLTPKIAAPSGTCGQELVIL